MKSRLFFAIVLVLSAGWIPTGSALAQVPQQINYQGLLTDSLGDPVADDNYLMIFSIYDAASGGTLLWSQTLTVPVAGGVYNVVLGQTGNEIDPAYLDGQRYLEVSVYNNGSSTWEPLSPRQQITSTAFALRAGDADTLEGNAIGDLDARYVQEGESGAVDSNMIADGTIGAADLGANSVGSSEIATNAVTSSEVQDNSLTAADLAANSVGSSELASNSVGSDEIINGSVTAADMQDGAALAEILDNDGSGSSLNADYLDGYDYSAFVRTTQDYGRSGVATTLYEGTSSLTSKYVNETGDSMTGQLTITNAGTGLLATANTAATTVYGVRVDANQSSTNNYSTYGLYVDADSAASSGSLYGTYANAQKSTGTTGTIYGAYNYSYHYGTGGATYGTRSYAYGSDTGDVYGMYGYAHKPSTDTAGIAYGGRFVADNESAGSSYAVYADASASDGTNIGVRAGASGGDYNYAIYASATGGTNWAGYFYGPVGVDVYGTGNSSQSLIIDPDDTTLELFESDGTRTVLLDGESGTNNGPFLYMYNNAGNTTVYLDGDSVDSGYLALYNAAGSATIRLDADYSGDGRIITEELQITGGSDFSEQFDVHKLEEVKPGLLMSIDPENPGKLRVSQVSYDKRVAGIISGANGIKPGMLMGQQGTEADGAHPVALTGRVYCWADTSNGPIEAGDLLTTSNVPGHAMKAIDRDRAFGATVGKAMTSLTEGRGLVLVLVSLQ